MHRLCANIMLFYIKELEHLKIWGYQGVLKLIPGGYQGMTVYIIVPIHHKIFH